VPSHFCLLAPTLHFSPTWTWASRSKRLRGEPLDKQHSVTFAKLEFTKSEILPTLQKHQMTAFRSLEGRFAHACTPEWRFSTQACPVCNWRVDSPQGFQP
jgi:hypothetical protein